MPEWLSVAHWPTVVGLLGNCSFSQYKLLIPALMVENLQTERKLQFF